DHLGAVGLVVVGLDLHALAALDHVVVGHGVAVGGDEEAGALRHAELAAAARTVGRAGQAEALEELLEPGRQGFAVELHPLALRQRLTLDAHADHGWLHALDDIGETDRPCRVFAADLSDRRRRKGKTCLHARAAEQQRGADTGHRPEEDKPAQGQNFARRGIVLLHRQKLHSEKQGETYTVLTAPVPAYIWRMPPYDALSAGLKFRKVSAAPRRTARSSIQSIDL